ncbi:ABC transporter permease [Corallincola holothuriorum]|uniref:ABC transporter permease n=2 Tax=Corallincola holothuriorum TaxID=2282215 RepID=A0A368NRN0_9GAMM|nr:ABC transporter permease [Corallincola holothuriorum]
MTVSLRRSDMYSRGIVAKALWQHYLRHPLQLILLLAGLVTGVVMVNGVALLNQTATEDYLRGEQLLGRQASAYVVAVSERQLIPQALYTRLRNMGLDSLVPVVSGTITDESRRLLSIIATDPLAFAAAESISAFSQGQNQGSASGGGLAEFILPPYAIWISVARAEQLGIQSGQRFQLKGGEESAPVFTKQGHGLGHRLWVDIGYGQQLLSMGEQLSYLAVMGGEQLDDIRAALPAGYKVRLAKDPLSLKTMTRSLHMNLTAMGLLAWVVGVFIVFNAVTFSLQDRRPLVRQLQMAGVPKPLVIRLFVIEFLLLACVAALLAAPLSVAMAEGLLPILGRTLDNLYGVALSYQSFWRADVLYRALIVSLVGVGLAASGPLWQLASHQPLVGVSQQYQLRQGKALQAKLALLGVSLLITAAVLAWQLPGLHTGFVTLALLLLGSGLLIPWLYSLLLQQIMVALPRTRPLLAWSCSELDWQLGRSHVAMLALVLALTANVGVNTMVGSFRDAVTTWLEQRLVADIYLRPEGRSDEIIAWLQDRDEVASLLLQKQMRTEFVLVSDKRAENNQPIRINLLSLASEQYARQAIAPIHLVEDGWQRFANGEGVLISERLSLLNGLELGDRIGLPLDSIDQLNNVNSNASGVRQQIFEVLGVYYDFGNPTGQMMLDEISFEQHWPGHLLSGIGIKLNSVKEKAGIYDQLVHRFQLNDRQIIDQQRMREVALGVFEQTFVATKALNVLTLLVAAAGLACALVLLNERRRLALAVLGSLGVTKRALFQLSLLQWASVGLITALLSLPFGIGLAWVLINLLNVYGFGWSYPVTLQWLDYGYLILLSTVITALTAILPLRRLYKMALARQLAEGQ